MPTTEVTIPAPVLEPVMIDSALGAYTLRLWRTATDLQDSPGGYRIFRSKSRTGFAGTSGDDDTGFEELATEVTQPAAGTIYVNQALSSQPTDTSVHYRVRGVDDTTTPTLYSAWSNVVTFCKISDRHVPIPVFPSALRPGAGVLSGIMDSLADDDISGPLTWYEFQRIAVLVIQDEIGEKLLDRLPERDVWGLMRDPPGDLVRWYEYRVAARLLPESTLQIAEVRERVPFYDDLADQARDGLFSSSKIHSPGSPTTGVLAGRRRR